MAALGFQVHTDKENETPLLRPIDKAVKGRSLQVFPNKGNSKLSNPTPRKALGSVNNQLPPAVQGIKGRGSEFSQGPIEALFNSKKSAVEQNLPTGHFTKKPKTKRSPVVHTGLKKPCAVKNASKPRTPKSKPKPAVEPIPKIPDDKEYDSDTIFPRTDRLSCYVDKLLTWRPPCLFGTLPDSDSDISIVEDLDESIELDQFPVSFCEVEDQKLPQDLSELLVDLPSVSPTNHCSEPSDRNISPDLYHLNDQSLDSSLHLGSLHFGTPEFELNHIKDNSLDAHSSSSGFE